MTKLRLLLAMQFAFFCVSAQLETQNWYFGNNAGITFSTNPPTALTGGAISTFEGTATISDANGNLLFYTDGMTVYNALHQQMPNGFGLMGNPSSAQSGIIVPKPGSQTMFYIFTVDAAGGPNGFRYSEVDISLQGGLGDVLPMTKNTLLFAPSVEKITAVSHANGLNYWVIGHGLNNNRYYAYLVDCDGVNSPVISDAGQVEGTPGWGCLTSSSDGAKLATAMRTKGFELLDFNNATGIVSNPILLLNPGGAYGISFSPNNQVLYACKIEGGQLYQWNVNAGSPAAIVASLQNLGVAQGTGTYKGGAIQRGLDGKLYLPHYNQPYLSCIQNPNALGISCNLQHFAVDLQGNNAVLGLPPFLQSFFEPTIEIQPVQNCDSVTFGFSGSNASFDSLVWNFGDPTSGNNTSGLFAPIHEYASVGQYTVSLITYLDCATDTVFQTINVSNSSLTFEADTACGAYNWNGATYSESGMYNYLAQSAGGCDSLVELQLTIFPSYTENQSFQLCDGEGVEVNGVSYTIPGSYTIPLETIQGCDSNLVVQISVVQNIEAPNITAVLPDCVGDSVWMTVPDNGNVVTWFGPNGLQSESATLSFPLMEGYEGEYGAYYSILGCTSDTSYYSLDLSGLDVGAGIEIPNVITSNGDGVNDTFLLKDSWVKCNDFNLVILNRWGQVVYSGNQDSLPFEGMDVKGQRLEEGIYFYKLIFQEGEKCGYLHITGS